LPAFGEVTTDLRAPQGELDSRESSPLDLLTANISKADDDSQRGQTVAPITEDEGEDDGDGETDAGTEAEVFYDVDPALVFAASVPLPDDGGDDDDDDGSDYQDDGGEESEGEEGEQHTEEEQKGAAAEPNEGEPATSDEEDDEEDGNDTPVGMSTFRHPGESLIRG
jgi:hypothetical protein